MDKINQISPQEQNFLQFTGDIANFPKSLYLIGELPTKRAPTVAIVGTRKPSTYGKEIGYKLSFELAKRGVIVVSGLALGIDGVAHQAALDAGGRTIAVLPTPLDAIHPRAHHNLARQIVQNRGALVSEYAPGDAVYQMNFIARNRIVAAIADGVLIIEAAIKSGTLHTAGFALDYNRPVMAVPGNITNPMSQGTNRLITSGARLITSVNDILDEIGASQPRTITQTKLPLANNAEEACIIKLMASGVRDADELQIRSKLAPHIFTQNLTMLEINGTIRPLGNNKWGIM